jgi:hypothetical protein
MRFLCLSSRLRTLCFTAIVYLFAPASAQAQSPYLYASIPNTTTTSLIAGYSVALDGTLTPVPGSPFNLSLEGGLVTTDPTDQFLFVLNATSNRISVLSIDSTGALSLVGSPVPAPTPPLGSGSAPSAPTCMATFKGTNANYLLVAYGKGPTPSTGAIVAFQIGTSAQPLLSPTITSFEAAPVDIAVSPKGYLYGALQLVPGSNPGNQTPGVAVLPLDLNSGQLGMATFANSNVYEDSIVLNPGATVLFDGEGTPRAGLLESSQIRSDGTTLPAQSLPVYAPNSPPSTLLVEGSGHLLYVQQGPQVAVYTIDQTTGILSAPSMSTAPVPFTIGHGNTVAHPVERYLYTLQSGGKIHVFEITDFTSGAVSELTDSAYTVAGGSGAAGLTLTHNASSQTAVPIAAQLVPAIVNLGEATVGLSVSNNSAILTNTGTQALSVSISITGADQGDFKFDPASCPSQLAARTSCSITVTFTPTEPGARQATLMVTDSAGSQTLQLTGNGVASNSGGSGGGSGGSGSGGGSGGGGSGSGGSGSGGSGNPPSQPTVSFAPPSLSFLSSAQGMASPQLNVTFTNSNTSPNAQPLIIYGLQIGGLNATDFTITAGCNAASYASGQACTVGIVFTPGAPGNRVATLVVTDNAANSPQYVALNGSIQSELLTISPGNTGLAQSIKTGQTADFLLTLNPSFSGTVSFSPCSGQPANATCTVAPAPASVVANQPASLTVTVATSESSMAFREVFGVHHTAPTALMGLLFATFISLLALVRKQMQRDIRLLFPPFRPNHANATAAGALLLLSLVSLAGCGGASTVATAPAVTPVSQSHTYTITITPNAITIDGLSVPNIQPIQLTLIVN